MPTYGHRLCKSAVNVRVKAFRSKITRLPYFLRETHTGFLVLPTENWGIEPVTENVTVGVNKLYSLVTIYIYMFFFIFILIFNMGSTVKEFSDIALKNKDSNIIFTAKGWPYFSRKCGAVSLPLLRLNAHYQSLEQLLKQSFPLFAFILQRKQMWGECIHTCEWNRPRP